MIKNFNDFLNESTDFNSISVKKGQKVKVELSYLEGKPVSDVIAYTDAEFNDYFKAESFSFLFGGDMMMLAKWNEEEQKWISNQ